MTRKALNGAKDRKLVTKQEAERIMVPRHRRHCPACGESFLQQTANHKGFCCACCAFDWGEAQDAGRLDRRIAWGVEVVLYEEGKVGVVESVPSVEQAVVKMGDGRRLTVVPREVERIQYLVVDHRADCPRKAGREWVRKLNGGA